MMKTKGFTLIEVLLALVILAIALTALLKITGQIINNTNRIKEKSIKHWIAMQAVASIQLESVPISSNQATTKATNMLGQTWYWRAQLSPTAVKTMQKISITVSKSQTGPFTDLLVAYRHAS
ncbi:MAG: GspI family T2SS minor pseudopilin variant LspI [Legionellaceae bacterium]|nr:GspI family T2SS minor pseudopilin variant LspI [Legionellaceae bacterium]